MPANPVGSVLRRSDSDRVIPEFHVSATQQDGLLRCPTRLQMKQHPDREKELGIRRKKCSDRYEKWRLVHQEWIDEPARHEIHFRWIQLTLATNEMNVVGAFIGKIPQRPQHVLHAVPPVSAWIATRGQQFITATQASLGVTNNLSAYRLKLLALMIAELVKGLLDEGTAVQDGALGPS